MQACADDAPRPVQPAENVALLLAGELRALAHPVLQGVLQHAVLRPLQPDVFVHASPADSQRPCASWEQPPPGSAKQQQHLATACAPRLNATPPSLVHEMLHFLNRTHRLRTAVVLLDDDLLLQQHEKWRALKSGSLRPVARAVAADDRGAGADAGTYAGPYAGGPTSHCAIRYENWQKGHDGALTLRMVLLWEAVEAEERRRGYPYVWMIRARPDLLWRCRLLPRA